MNSSLTSSRPSRHGVVSGTAQERIRLNCSHISSVKVHNRAFWRTNHWLFWEGRSHSLTKRQEQTCQTEWRRLYAVENPGDRDVGSGSRDVIRGVDKQRDVEKDEIQKQTLRLVETSMLAATTGLAFFLSNNLRIESYFSFFFPLPAVLAAAKWGATAGIEVVTTAALLVFLLAGPVKALTFLFLHGLLGAALGCFWMSGIPWSISIPACALIRASAAIAFVFLSSWLINENILMLILVNLQTSLTYVFGAISPHLMPSFPFCVSLFSSLLLFNSAAFAFLLHVLFIVFLQRLGFTTLTRPPAWMQRVL